MGLTNILRPSDDDEQRRREEQKQSQMHMQNLSGDARVADGDYVDRITESELNQGTLNILRNLLTKDLVLANLDDAEVHEMRWLARVMELQLDALHPAEDSIWTGEYRKFASGEGRQALRPLDSAQRLETNQVIQGAILRATRSKDGWQQENFRKQIKQSETVDRSSDEEGGWL